MKAITVWQPWASLLACGAKKYETRSWATNYRGPIAIHAAKKSYDLVDIDFGLIRGFMSATESALGIYEANNAPLGAVIATAELVGCYKTFDPALIGEPGNFPCIEQPNQWKKIFGNELLFGDFSPGRYAWEFINMKMLDTPIPATGKQRLWEWQFETEDTLC